jgi:hypothetical protein
MKKSLTTLALLATASMLPLAVQTASAATSSPQPMFVVLPEHGTGKHFAHTPTALQTWTGTFTYNKVKHTYTMVGTSPFTTNTTTTITVDVIPVKMVYGSQNGNMTFDPMVDQQNGVSIIQNLLNSPLLNSLDWKWGATDVGSTQYIDAWQRGAFWGEVKTNTAYHVVLAPTTLSEVSHTVQPGNGSVMNNPFGSGVVGTENIGVFDTAIQGWIAGFSQVNPSTFPLFVTDNIYLTSGGCCIGGYHSAEANGQTYGYSTYVTSPGAFSEDISALSHEVGEWYDDPATHNRGYCGGLLEVGDPLEGKANYGTFPVTFGGVTWHPQALVFISYFGAPKKKSANSWLDNQHIETSVCQNGQ